MAKVVESAKEGSMCWNIDTPAESMGWYLRITELPNQTAKSNLVAVDWVVVVYNLYLAI
jgi:hypothetical protein